MKKHSLIVSLIVALACLSSPNGVLSNEDQPNILLILADDLGYGDLGFQGSKDIRSPNLDKLASGSIRFTDAHVSASVCSPSRAGLMTGRYQQRFGHEANSPRPPLGMDVQETTIAQSLKSRGYRTGLVGKWHLGSTAKHYPTQRGFDSFYGLREGSRSYFYDPDKNDWPGDHHAIERNGKQVKFDGYLTDVFGKQAIEFIKQPSDKPFFLFLSFTAPHGPMHATEKDLARFDHITDKRRRTYAAMVWAMDRAIGQVMEELERNGQLDNTLIWFLSDNGGATNNASSNLPLAGHKGIKFEGGIRVPFLMQWKAKFPKPKVESRMISALDIMPTSIAAAGVSKTTLKERHPLDGVNLLPYLHGEISGTPHQRLYWHKLWFSAMRDGPWKLIYVQEYGYALYNLDEDISETNNVLTRYPDRVDAMKEELNRWKAKMMKPLWTENKRWFRLHRRNHVRIIEGNN